MWIGIGIIIIVLFVFFRRVCPNNFVLIARNLTYIYEVLRNEYKERFPDEDAIFITCGAIDTGSYNFPIEDIKLALSRAKEGTCFLEESQDNIKINTRNLILLCKKDLFLNFVLELEIMIFLRDTSLHRDDILTAVVSVTEKIEKAIVRAKGAYARGKRPFLWHRAVSNFMTSDTLEQVRDQIGIICPKPEQQLDFLFQELVKRKHWKDINPEIIKDIFNNAKGDIDAIKRFIFISEQYNTTGNNYVQLANNTPKEFVLSIFALTLYRLGSDLVKSLSSAETEDEVGSLVRGATMAYMSSVLCAPYFLESYVGMAYLYGQIDKDIALEWCAKYKEAEEKLLNTPDEELNMAQLNRKKEILEPGEHHKTLREISARSQHIHLDEAEIDGIPSIREMIVELEAELMQQA